MWEEISGHMKGQKRPLNRATTTTFGAGGGASQQSQNLIEGGTEILQIKEIIIIIM